MEITTPTQQPNTGITTPNTAANTTNQSSPLSSDFETFIRMLTTQMQNQDPLNPIESADFAVQLATFSSVEQQVQTNNLLTALGDQFAGLSVAQLSGWIGMNARAAMPVQFNGAPVDITLEAAPEADAAELIVQDSRGIEILRQSAPAESGTVEWAGVTDSGAPLPPGTYSLSLASYVDGELVANNPVITHDRIVEARVENGQTVLIMSGGQQVSSDEILGLRQPNTSS